MTSSRPSSDPARGVGPRLPWPDGAGGAIPSCDNRAGRPHVPERTCAGCGVRAPQAELRRLAVAAGGQALEWRARGGRGTYLHDSPDCRRRFLSGKRRLPGLRASIGREARQALIDATDGTR